MKQVNNFPCYQKVFEDWYIKIENKLKNWKVKIKPMLLVTLYFGK